MTSPKPTRQQIVDQSPHLNWRRVLWVIAGEILSMIGGALMLLAAVAGMLAMGIKDADLPMAFGVVGMLAFVFLGSALVKRAWDWQDKRIKGDRP